MPQDPYAAIAQPNAGDPYAAIATARPQAPQPQESVRLSDPRTVPNARIRNMPNPVDPSWSPWRSLYEGAKTGLTLGSIPASTAVPIGTLARTVAGGLVGSKIGQTGADAR